MWAFTFKMYNRPIHPNGLISKLTVHYVTIETGKRKCAVIFV